MALTNNLKKQVDLPVWEWCRFFPAANSAISEMCAARTPGHRYIYMIVSSTFWRYDTYADNWMVLAPPPTAPLLIASLKYFPYGGFIGQVLPGSTSTTFVGACLQGKRFIGNKVRIIAGVGAGQERTITGHADATIWDSGLATTATTSAITDNLKKWEVNQWSGYFVKIVNGAGVTQRRKILYNSATVLTVSDTNWQQLAPQENMPFATAPTTASLYTIESSVMTVSPAWTVTPNTTSKFRVLTGVIAMTSTVATAPFVSCQVYDIAHDIWVTRSVQQGTVLAAAAVANDASLARLDEGEMIYVSTSGTATSGSATTLVDSTKTWTVNQWVGEQVKITGGAGINQISLIISNTATQLTFATGATIDSTSTYEIGNWCYDSGYATVTGSGARALGDTTKNWAVDQWANYQVSIVGGTGVGNIKRILGNSANILYTDGAMTATPDETSVYTIIPMESLVILSGWANSSLLGFNTNLDQTCQSFFSDGGLANVMSVRSPWWMAVAATATRAVNGIKTILSTPTAGGTGYTVGDVLTCNQTGTGGLIVVTSTDNNGVVTGLKLQKCGTNYAIASGRTTTGGTGTGCTFEITALDTIGTITTAINHNFQIGDLITFAGATEAAWNSTTTVIGVSGLTTFDIVTTATSTAVATVAQSATVIVDSSKSWTINEHAGKIVQLATVGTAGTTQIRRILSNTATSLTIYGTNITAAVEGTSRYIIYDPDAFGRAVQTKYPTRTNTGWATSGTATTLVDNTKVWKGNEWLGYKVRVISGTGFDKGELVITSNSATTLTVSGGYGFTPDTTTKYIIEDTFGVPTTVTNTTNAVITDTTKAWLVNQWAGFRIRITAGEGAGQEATITSNTATALTITGVFTTAPVANSSMYTILGCSQRGTGHEIFWLYGTTSDPGRYILSPKGGATNVWDRFDITKNTWDLAFCSGPDTDTFTVGTMYAYDGVDRLYIQKDSTGRCMYIDLAKYKMDGAGMMPYVIGTSGIGTAVNGNRMEIITTEDGLKYLYIMKHTGAALSATGGGTEMFRQLIFY